MFDRDRSTGIVYVSVFTLVIMYVASRLFATEKVLTAKLKFRGPRKRAKAPVDRDVGNRMNY